VFKPSSLIWLGGSGHSVARSPNGLQVVGGGGDGALPGSSHVPPSAALAPQAAPLLELPAVVVLSMVPALPVPWFVPALPVLLPAQAQLPKARATAASDTAAEGKERTGRKRKEDSRREGRRPRSK
jgi:hypothetical protein